jgi:hypothetical protein
MAFNFPNSPTEGDIFTDAASGAQYVYRNGVWMQTSAAQIKLPAVRQNMLVNGAFQISQELGDAGSVASAYIADQWLSGFGGVACTAARQYSATWGRHVINVANTAIKASPAAGDWSNVQQRIEGSRLKALHWGAANAGLEMSAVLNFKMAATVAGTYGVSIQSSNGDKTIAFDLPYTPAEGLKEFTLPIPAPGGGTWALDTGSMGGLLAFAQYAGSSFRAAQSGVWGTGNALAGPGMTNNWATANNFLYICDAQLVADPLKTGAAPPFVQLPFGEDLADCQRYYIRDAVATYILSGYRAVGAGDGAYGHINFPVAMRAGPTLTFTGVSYSNASGLAMGNVSTLGARYSITAAGVNMFYAVFGYTANSRI